MYKASPSKVWRNIKNKYRLVGVKCRNCKSSYYPPVSLCPKCQEKGKIENVVFENEGKILTYSIVRVAPIGYEHCVPYPVAIVQLNNGPKVSAQIVDWKEKDLKIGQKVEAVFRKLFETDNESVIHYGIKFRPVRNGNL